MIELPRAAVTADEIATQADFFSFGTNDLTQTTFGFQPRRRRGRVRPAATLQSSFCRTIRSQPSIRALPSS